MLLPSDADTIQAPPNSLLVERETPQDNYSGIIQLSQDYLKYTLGSAAIIRAVGYGVTQWKVGDRVLLNSGVGKKIEFGWKPDRTFYKVTPYQILLHLFDGEEAAATSSPYRGMKERDFDLVQTDGTREEGDPQGLR